MYTRLVSLVNRWPSICIQDIVLHYQINPISDYQIYLTRFLYQICLTGKSDKNGYLYVQNTEAHEKPSQTPKMELFAKIS